MGWSKFFSGDGASYGSYKGFSKSRVSGSSGFNFSSWLGKSSSKSATGSGWGRFFNKGRSTVKTPSFIAPKAAVSINLNQYNYRPRGWLGRWYYRDYPEFQDYMWDNPYYSKNCNSVWYNCPSTVPRSPVLIYWSGWTKVFFCFMLIIFTWLTFFYMSYFISVIDTEFMFFLLSLFSFMWPIYYCYGINWRQQYWVVDSTDN